MVNRNVIRGRPGSGAAYVSQSVVPPDGVLVAVVGVLVRAPLARVPENTMKFAVGVMLTTFGTFWATEGAGAHWPGDDAALPVVLAFVVALSFAAVAMLRRQRPAYA